MAWFGDGLSSLSNLKGQITSFTKEVLSDSIVNDTDGESKQLEEANVKCVQLQELLNSRDAEISVLRRQNCELQKAVVESNVRALETQDVSADEGGGFFWDPPASNREVKSNQNQVRELQDKIDEATVRIRELEEEVEKYRNKSIDKLDDVADGHQKAEILRAKQDIVNRIIQIGEKGREAERNMKKQHLDESTFVNDFRAAISKLDSHEQIHLIRCALHALELDNGNELKDNDDEKKNTLKKRYYSQRYHDESTNGVHNREVDLLDKINKLQEENKNLTASIEELDQQHSQSIEKVLSIKEELEKKHKSLQAAYESLYVDYNSCQDKLNKLESEFPNNNSTINDFTSNKFSSEDKNIQTKLISDEEKNINNESTQTDDNNHINFDILIKRVNDIIKDYNIKQDDEDETIFETVAKHYVEASWKKDTLERQMTELTHELEQTNQIRDNLQMECDELQHHVESLEMEIQHVKSNLPSIPEESEEKVGMLEAENESMSQEIKRLEAECDLLNHKNSELITAMSNVEGSLRNQENLEAEVRNTKQQLVIAQQQLAGASKNVENNENMMEDLSRRLHAALDENNELRNKNDAMETRERQMQEQLIMYEGKCKSLDENIELIEELKLDINNVRKELKHSLDNNKRLESELTIVHEAKGEIERDILALSQEKEQLEMEMVALKNNGRIDEDSNLIRELREQLDQANHEKNDLEYDLMNMRKELDAALSQAAASENECHKLDDEIKKLCEDNKNAYNQLTIATEDSKERLELLSRELNSLQQEHIFLQEEARADKAELDELKIKFEKCELQSREFEIKLQESRAECQEFKNLCENLQSRGKIADELEKEISRLEAVEEKLKESDEKYTEMEEKYMKLKNVNEELIVYEEKYLELEEKLKRIEENKSKEDVDKCHQLEEDLMVLLNEKQKLIEDKKVISDICASKTAELESLIVERNELMEQLATRSQELQSSIDKSREAADMARETIENLSEIVNDKDKEIASIKSSQASDVEKKVYENENILTSLKAERDELIKLVQVKHNESLQYHAEIKRMTQLFNEQATALQTSVAERESYEKLVKDKEAEVLWAQNELKVVRQRLKNLEESTNYGEICNVVEHSSKLAQLSMLIEKSNALEAALVQEQASNRMLQNQLTESQQRENSAARELERLRSHLMEIEENHTEEMLILEQSKKEMENKLLQAEEQLKNSSNVYTSANIRANQQVETLQQQVALVAQQRDEIQNKLSAAEDKVQSQTAALTNLQIVLEQFQRDKESDIRNATDRIRHQLNDSFKKQDELNEEIKLLKNQLTEARECLQAASRLSEQLDKKTERIQELNDEVSKLNELVNTAEQRIKEAKESGAGKVDKNLVKNLLLGFISASAPDKPSVLRVMATVLDFNETERDKSGLNNSSAHGGWFSGLLHSGNPTKDQEASLSAAFVRFLESESKPMSSVPALPISNTPITRPGHSRQHSTSSTHSGGLLLSNMTLPSFPDFVAPRNTGSILKEVLKDS
ncbi:thyroid receptor-interacting protein 11-like [Microplitis mediator]|uniref:thyroid receptor-interacting protein 11-like n=1 Tax=Microplitis mediator TaxID=375433 RepID=UPI002552EAD3|nr:thyroid receptor-interacting protein 11-like [Microplitis mediator]